MGFTTILRDRGFFSLWSSFFISKIGDSIHEIALIWIIYEVTGQPSLVALVIIASTVPHILLSLPGGAIADQVDRKWLLIISQIVRGVAVLAIPLVGDHPYLLYVVLGVAFVSGMMSAFFLPARQAIVPDIVSDEELDSANSLMEMTESFSLALYVVGGVVVAVVGSFFAFYVNSATFLISAAILFGIPSSDDYRMTTDDAFMDDLQSKLGEDIRDGLSYVRADPILLTIIFAVSLINFASGPLSIVLAVLSDEILGGDSVIHSVIYTSLFIGVILGGVLINNQKRYVSVYRGKLIVGGVILNGVMYAAAGLLAAQIAVEAAVVAVSLSICLAGVAISMIKIPTDTYVQQSAPNEVIGKIFSVIAVLGNIFRPVGLAIAGPLLEIFTSDAVLVGQGLFIFILGVGLVLTGLYQYGDSDTGKDAAETTESTDYEG